MNGTPKKLWISLPMIEQVVRADRCRLSEGQFKTLYVRVEPTENMAVNMIIGLPETLDRVRGQLGYIATVCTDKTCRHEAAAAETLLSAFLPSCAAIQGVDPPRSDDAEPRMGADDALHFENGRHADIVERLRERVRIPITDGLGPVDGHDDYFERNFPSSNAAKEAADYIEKLRAALRAARME
jgi:hypothetical protein